MGTVGRNCSRAASMQLSCCKDTAPAAVGCKSLSPHCMSTMNLLALPLLQANLSCQRSETCYCRPTGFSLGGGAVVVKQCVRMQQQLRPPV